MKRFTLTLIILVLAMTTIFLVACEKKEQEPTTTYKVTLDYSYNSKVENINVKKGEKVKVNVENRVGYAFDGWYKNDKKFDLNTAITQDTVLKARWIKLHKINLIEGSKSEVVYVMPKDSYVIDDFKLRDDLVLNNLFTKVDGQLVPADMSKDIKDNATLYADVMNKDIKFEKTDAGYIVKSVPKDAKEIYIPSTYKGESVVTIGNIAFTFGDNYNTSNLAYDYVYIGDKVERIVSGAFNSVNIKEIDFAYNSSLKVLEENAFSNVDMLEKIVLPKGLSEINSYTFWACNDLKECYIPSSVKNLPDYIFMGSINMKTIFLEGSQDTYAKGFFWDFAFQKADGSNDPRIEARFNTKY